MENKYYTPDLEEFHIGFEYEQYEDYDYLPEKSWHKLVYGVGSTSNPESMSHPSTPSNLRVKYLDKADIESCDMELIITEMGEDTSIYPDIYYNTSMIGTFYGQDSPHGVSNLEIFNTFYQIKNKSEFKRIVRQLGIKTKS